MQLIKRAVWPLLLLASASAGAQVIYTFDALSSFPLQDETGATVIPSLMGSFSLTAPDFITADTTFTPGQLTSCSVTGGFACASMEFIPAVTPTNDAVTFGVVLSPATSTYVYYYFNVGDVSTLGTHASTLLGSGQAATVTVTAVPEPSTHALMLAGLGVFGLWSAWRKRRFVASPA